MMATQPQAMGLQPDLMSHHNGKSIGALRGEGKEEVICRKAKDLPCFGKGYNISPNCVIVESY